MKGKYIYYVWGVLIINFDTAHYSVLASRNPSTNVAFYREADHSGGLSMLIDA